MNIAWLGKRGIEEKRNAVTTLLKLRWRAKFTENTCWGRSSSSKNQPIVVTYVSTPEERNNYKAQNLQHNTSEYGQLNKE